MTVLLPLLVGCGTEIGNPELDFAALARTTAPEVVGLASGAGVVVDEAWVTLRDVRFEAAETCDEEPPEAEIEGPWTVDLLDLDPLPIVLPARSLCRLRLRLDRADGGALEDLSVRIAGRRSDGVPFVVESREAPDVELRARGADAFTTTEGVEDLLLTFDVARWLTMDLDGLTPGGDETIRIDGDTNRDALDQFDDALERSLELFEDVDGDGVVGPDDDPLASAS